MSATRSVANGAAAAALALALSSGNMQLTPPAALAEPPAVVQQYGSSMLADSELSDEQKRFLEERKKMATKYEMSTESTFKSAEEVKDKKNVYVAIVGGLVVVAFVCRWFSSSGTRVASRPMMRAVARSGRLIMLQFLICA